MPNLNKRISGLTPSASNLQDVDLVEVEPIGAPESKRYTGAQVRAVEKAERQAQDDVIEASVGLATDGTFVPYSGTNHIDAATTIAEAVEILDGVLISTDGSNVGTGDGEVFKEAVGNVLRFRNIKNGTYTTVTIDSDDIVVDVDPNTLPLRSFVKASQIETQKIENTTVETSLIGVSTGDFQFAANRLSAGDTIKLTLDGTYKVGLSSELFTLRMFFGGNKIADFGGSLVSNDSTEWGYRIELCITVQTTGATADAVMNGKMEIETRSTGFSQSRFINSSTPITIDTTVANDIDVTFQWGDAEATNIINNTRATLELLDI